MGDDDENVAESVIYSYLVLNKYTPADTPEYSGPLCFVNASNRSSLALRPRISALGVLLSYFILFYSQNRQLHAGSERINTSPSDCFHPAKVQ